MKYKLGQKVRYKRITRKIEINMQYWDVPDFEQDEEKELARREFIELDKERIGYIVGRRKLVFTTIFGVEVEERTMYEPGAEWVEIKRQEYKFAYLIAYNMGKTNYVLEEDLKYDYKKSLEED